MAPKSSSPRTWYDVQMAIAAIAMSSTLALWNLFAGPDREQAARKAAEQAQAVPVPTELPATALTPTPMPIVKIIFGSSAPQASQPNNSPRKVRNNGGGGGGGGATSTKSS